MAWNLNDFITMDFLGTFSGVVALVTLLTQLIKRFVSTVDPKWISLTLAGTVSFIKQLETGDFTTTGWILAALNAFVITGAAIGAFEGCKGIGKLFE
ncbi:MAG: hypothetical protein FWD84_00910 [Oscillospiraceae bacterium]|nr:hypothetical protein [Oscillospiraceae bacterium]